MVDASLEPVAEMEQHELTYRHFQLALRWIIVVHAAGVPFLVLWFCTGAGFLGAAVVGLIIFALGLFWLTHRKSFDDLASHAS